MNVKNKINKNRGGLDNTRIEAILAGTKLGRTEQNRTKLLFAVSSGHSQVAYEIKQYICQK